MSEILEVSQSLQEALKAAADAEAKLEKAKQNLTPLEEAAAKAHDEVNSLIARFQLLSGAIAPVKRRGGARGQRKKYNITAESKIAATGKRAYTRAKNAGKGEKEAKAAQKQAETALAAKLKPGHAGAASAG